MLTNATTVRVRTGAPRSGIPTMLCSMVKLLPSVQIEKTVPQTRLIGRRHLESKSLQFPRTRNRRIRHSGVVGSTIVIEDGPLWAKCVYL